MTSKENIIGKMLRGRRKRKSYKEDAKERCNKEGVKSIDTRKMLQGRCYIQGTREHYKEDEKTTLQKRRFKK